MDAMSIGILTSGGDCPGLNAVIRAAVFTGSKLHDMEFVGFKNGWKGLVEGDTTPLGRPQVMGISKQGGTILGTSRTNPFENGGGPERIAQVMEENGVDALIAIGGEGTLAAAKRLTDAGINIVGVPKTIDNDLSATDYTFGFDTAVQIATDAMDRLRTTGDSHGRCMVAEVMGRHVGWIALHSGISGGADVILLPELPFNLERVYEKLRQRYERRSDFAIVVVSEGARPAGGAAIYKEAKDEFKEHASLGGVAEWLTKRIQADTGYEARSVVLGHLHWDHTQGLPFSRALDHDGADVQLCLPEQEDGVDALAIIRRAMSRFLGDQCEFARRGTNRMA